MLDKFEISKIDGFTFTELVYSAAVSVIALSVSGFGLVSVTASSTSNTSQNERGQELNRAADFIASEVRHAEEIVPDASVIAARPRNFSPETDARVMDVEPVVMLKIKGTSASAIVYYLATPPTGPWIGPKVIYRWGPSYSSDGAYENVSDSSQWTHQPLIDQIEASGTVPSCTSGWIGNGSPGFYVCVHSSGKVAQIHKLGTINPVLGQSDTYKHAVTVATRIQRSSIPPFSLGSGRSSVSTHVSPTNSCVLIMDEDSLDTDVPSIEQAAQKNNTDASTLINKGSSTERGNPTLAWSTRYSGDTVTLPTGQVGDEGLFSLPLALSGKNGLFTLDSFIAGLVPQADLDEVRGVQPLGNAAIQDLLGKSCIAIAYDSDVSINYDPLEANLQGERLGRFHFTVLGIEPGPELNRLRIRVDPAS